MNKMFLMRNPELFQGERILGRNKNYFEGWYFKNTSSSEGISFIPGISIDDRGKRAFIQVITDNSSCFVNYDIDDFKFEYNPFFVQIGNCSFSKEGIHIDIQDDVQELKIYGDLKYLFTKNIKTNFLNPNIMGPFSYVPFMECNHAILSMKNRVDGLISINDRKISFIDSIGYIEKDWGVSFPKSYIWCQGNDFENSNASFMISVADIPFKLFNFRGLICVLCVGDKEYKFTTYNNSKILKFDVNNNFLDITIKKGSYYLDIKTVYGDNFKLIAPEKGGMKKDIFESICSSVDVTLRKNKDVIFSDMSRNCGLEVVS